MTTASVIIFDNLLAEAKYAFHAEDYATIGRLALEGKA